MSALSVILTIAFPVFALVALGYAGGRLRVMGSEATVALNAFVAAFALPALLFSLLAQARIGEILNLDYALVMVGAMFGTLVIDMLLARLVTRGRFAEHALHGLSASFGNVGYMGVPLCIAAFGPAGVLPATLSVVIGAAGLMSLCVVLIGVDLHAGHGLGRTLSRVARAVARNPLLIAVAAGLAVSTTHTALPEALQRFLGLLGAAASPCALFAIGLFLSDKSLTANFREVSVAVASKLILQPAIACVLVWWLLGFDTMWGKSAIILAALPGASNAFILARQYGRFVERASAIVFLSTLLSVPTVSLLLVVLDIGRP